MSLAQGMLQTGLVLAWFQLGSTWFLIAGYSKTHYVCLVLAWFQLGSSLVPLGFRLRMPQNVRCLHGSGLVPLGSSARDAKTHHVGLVLAWFQLGSSLVPLGF